MPNLIIGIDPGTTLGFAILNFEGKILKVSSSKTYNLSSLINEVIRYGQPLIVGPDKKNIPKFVSEFAKKVGAHVVRISEDMAVKDKKELIKRWRTNNDHERVKHTNNNRAINRHQWDYQALEQLLTDGTSHHYQVFQKLNELMAIRRLQSAFHPNATQFTLQLGPQMFGYWRQSMDRRQSIFCINNISDETQTLLLSDINLISTDHWHDLLNDQISIAVDGVIQLSPYQTVWISNQ